MSINLIGNCPPFILCFLEESKFIWVNLWMTIQIKIELDHNKTK